jgi:uncharacterized protein (TIGR03437 family)
VPETLRGNKQASVQVIAPSGTVDVSGLTVQDYLPTMFSTIAGFAAPALNENGSVNSAFNPARQGSIVAVWLTGIGSATGSDNTINISAPRSSTAPVSVMPLGLSGPGAPLPVYYVGDAPEKPAGVSQINFRLPEGREFSGGSPSFIVQAGSEVSQTFAIYVE